MVPDEEGNWDADPSMQVTCAKSDNTIFFEGSVLQPSITGFYVERVLSDASANQFPVFSQVATSVSENPAYLSKISDDVWIVGSQYGVDQGVAYVDDGAELPHLINNVEWKFIDSSDVNATWQADVTDIYHPARHGEFDPESREFANVYTTLRFAHSIK